MPCRKSQLWKLDSIWKPVGRLSHAVQVDIQPLFVSCRQLSRQANQAHRTESSARCMAEFLFKSIAETLNSSRRFTFKLATRLAFEISTDRVAIVEHHREYIVYTHKRYSVHDIRCDCGGGGGRQCAEHDRNRHRKQP